MKKKLTAGLALAIVLSVLAVSAFAAYVLLWSPQADAQSQARQALTDAYGLTPESLGCFVTSARQDGDAWTVTFTGDGFNPGLLGTYTVVISGGNATASWSHDDVDRAEWENGGLMAPVWGQPQIAEALRDTEAAEAAQLELIADAPATEIVPMVTPPGGPESLEEGAAYWNGELIRISTPGENDLTGEQAMEIAYQAFLEEFGVTREELDAGTVVGNDFYTREDGGTLWGISINILKDGVDWGCGVTMDGATGEILMINVVTGGNS
ncbi:MAG TPA: hypothetical protein PKU80_09995 [Candidatus Limiplasma sp.]|nr:hypothetical protein [Candidatus Limiplasma sp.]